VKRPFAPTAGALILALAWLVPMNSGRLGPFTTHMVAHLAVVAVAAPLLALGLAGRKWDPVRLWPGTMRPLALSVLELIVVWSWHAPTLHHAARGSLSVRALEQGSFLVVALLLWISVLGGEPGQHAERRATGVLALLLTSMHMTLLGALLALPPRPLYVHSDGGADWAGALADQHTGGALMIAVGGVTYLVGGLALTRGLLGQKGAPATGAVGEGHT
jgi:putative membrane protein